MEQVTRRNFLKSASIVAAGAAVVGLAGCSSSDAPAAEQELGAMPETGAVEWAGEADFIIVGSGAAGLAAAITCYDEGLGDAIVLEVAPEEEMGGNSRCCGQGVFSPDSVEAAIEYQSALSLPYVVEDDIMNAWAEEICKNVDWLTDVVGADLTMENHPEFPEMPGSDHILLVNPEEGRNTDGSGTLWLDMKDKADELGVPFEYEARAVSLVTGDGNEVRGVVTEDGRNFKARKGVILAAGGFEFNEEMMQTYCPCGYSGTKGKGTWWNRGDGILMAQAVGAKLWHMNNFSGNYPGFRTLAADNDDARTWPSFKTHDYIFLDAYGDRYMNEDCMGIGEGLLRHGKIFRHGSYADLDLPTGGWCIFGQNAFDSGNLFSSSSFAGQLNKVFNSFADNQAAVDAGVVIKCETLAEVAAATGYDEAKLAAVIEQYNGFVDAGFDEHFYRGSNLSAMGQLVPSPGHENDEIYKAAFDLEKIESPYYVTEIVNTVLNSQGGPKRNANGQIVGAIDETPIPRLYGAGEMGAPYPYLYNQGGNFGEAMSSGRIAVRHAATLDSWEA